MNIEIYALCHQEAQMIPYFMRHYSQYGKVFLFEGHSTDGSAELARSLGATIIPVDTGNEIRDDIFTDLKNNYWKNSKADWVIICDMDEFVYHPNFLEYLKTLECTVVRPAWYEMFSDVFPTTQGQIYEEINMGFYFKIIHHPIVIITDKLCLFKPRELTEMNYKPGCHEAHPEGNVIVNEDSEIICMHMRHLSLDYIMKRNTYFSKRRSAINRQNGWGSHLESSRENVQEWFDIHKPKLVKVPVK